MVRRRRFVPARVQEGRAFSPFEPVGRTAAEGLKRESRGKAPFVFEEWEDLSGEWHRGRPVSLQFFLRVENDVLFLQRDKHGRRNAIIFPSVYGDDVLLECFFFPWSGSCLTIFLQLI